MKYDIYFHNDFDGRASAAVMLSFLRSRGDDIERYIPVNFDIIPRWPRLRFEKPSIIVDFPYHPRATFWFDHHPTSFIKPSWKKNFKKTKFHHWDPGYYSCCHQVLDALARDFDFKAPKHFKELVRRLDVIDGARYKSPLETMELKDPAIQLAAFIDKKDSDAKLTVKLIKLLAECDLKSIVQKPEIRREISRIRKEIKKSLEFYSRKLQIFGRLTFIDLRNFSLGELLFAPYYLFPKSVYALRLDKKSKTFHLGLGVNPWRSKENKIHIGNFLRRRYARLGSAGGHKGVGGINTKSEIGAEKAAREIIEYFK